jgi:hypothetical protein
MTEIEIEIDKEVFLPCYRHLQDDTGIDIDLSTDLGTQENRGTPPNG